MNAIIVGFTPFHLLPIRELATAVDGDLHIFHPMADEVRAMGLERRLTFLGGCDVSHRSRWTRYFHARRDIDRLMSCGEQVDLYVPHPFNPLSNYAFFHAKPSRRFIYQDGILNYYDASTPLASYSSRMRQRVKAAALGRRYHMYEGHLSGIDCRPVAGGFFTHPDRIVSAEKFPMLRRLDFMHDTRKVHVVSEQDVLFLDQPVELLVGAERARELRRRTVEYVNALGGRVFYKPHYAQGRVTSCGHGWVPIASELNALPAEWVVARMNVSHVVSFCTSALVNIATSDSAITCHATAAKLVPVSADGKPTDLGEIFSGLGVEVADLLSH